MIDFQVGDEVRILNGGWFGKTGKILWRANSSSPDHEYFYRVRIAGVDKITSYYDDEMQLLQRGKENETMAEIKDSGERTVFSTGSVRDMSEGKGNMAVMPWSALLRVSKHYEAGARKYGPENYKRGIPCSSFLDSAFRHMAKYAAGFDDEDHLSAAIFNLLGLAEMEENHPDMCDIPARVGKNKFPYYEKSDVNDQNATDQ